MQAHRIPPVFVLTCLLGGGPAWATNTLDALHGDAFRNQPLERFALPWATVSGLGLATADQAAAIRLFYGGAGFEGIDDGIAPLPIILGSVHDAIPNRIDWLTTRAPSSNSVFVAIDHSSHAVRTQSVPVSAPARGWRSGPAAIARDRQAVSRAPAGGSVATQDAVSLPPGEAPAGAPPSRPAATQAPADPPADNPKESAAADDPAAFMDDRVAANATPEVPAATQEDLAAVFLPTVFHAPGAPADGGWVASRLSVYLALRDLPIDRSLLSIIQDRLDRFPLERPAADPLGLRPLNGRGVRVTLSLPEIVLNDSTVDPTLSIYQDRPTGRGLQGRIALLMETIKSLDGPVIASLVVAAMGLVGLAQLWRRRPRD